MFLNSTGLKPSMDDSSLLNKTLPKSHSLATTNDISFDFFQRLLECFTSPCLVLSKK